MGNPWFIERKQIHSITGTDRLRSYVTEANAKMILARSRFPNIFNFYE